MSEQSDQANDTDAEFREIRHYFTEEKWNSLSVGIKRQYVDLKRNFELLTQFGLQPICPEFMCNDSIKKEPLERERGHGKGESSKHLLDIKPHEANGASSSGSTPSSSKDWVPYYPTSAKTKRARIPKAVLSHSSPPVTVELAPPAPGTRTYPCQQCPKVFRHSLNLRQHMTYTHSDERPHVCEFCGGKYKQRASLRAHIDSKHSPAEYPCQLCGAVLSSFSNLGRHVNRAHPQQDRPIFSCAACGKSFPSNFAFQYHVTTVHHRLTPLAVQYEQPSQQQNTNSNSGTSSQQHSSSNSSPSKNLMNRYSEPSRPSSSATLNIRYEPSKTALMAQNLRYDSPGSKSSSQGMGGHSNLFEANKSTAATPPQNLHATPSPQNLRFDAAAHSTPPPQNLRFDAAQSTPPPQNLRYDAAAAHSTPPPQNLRYDGTAGSGTARGNSNNTPPPQNLRYGATESTPPNQNLGYDGSGDSESPPQNLRYQPSNAGDSSGNQAHSTPPPPQAGLRFDAPSTGSAHSTPPPQNMRYDHTGTAGVTSGNTASPQNLRYESAIKSAPHVPSGLRYEASPGAQNLHYDSSRTPTPQNLHYDAAKTPPVQRAGGGGAPHPPSLELGIHAESNGNTHNSESVAAAAAAAYLSAQELNPRKAVE